MDPHQLIVLTPPGTVDPSVAIAAYRAGAVGVLDLEFSGDSPTLTTALARLARFAGRGHSVLLRPDNHQLISLLLSTMPRPARVILAGPHCDELISAIRRFGDAAIEVLREVTSIDEARSTIETGIAGLILKGHEAGGRVGSDTSFVLVQKWRRFADLHDLTLPFWVRGGIGCDPSAN